MPSDDVQKFLNLDLATLDSLVEVGLDRDVRNSFGVEPIMAGSGTGRVIKKRSLMFSYSKDDLLEKEVGDEALQILKQKQDQERIETGQVESNAAAIEAEMEELQKRSKMESKAVAKQQKEDADQKAFNEVLNQEWEKTAKSASELIKMRFTKF